MKERGILMSAPMVRAILAGTKTQTRRVLKDQPLPGEPTGFLHISCPYGQPGDRLWVRETWQHSNSPNGPWQDGCSIFYRADYLNDPLGPDLERSADGIRRRWIPSIHMPRAASRITLEITGVRVERLQEISREDAIAEGTDWKTCPTHQTLASMEAQHMARKIGLAAHYEAEIDYIGGYRALWESINGPGSWAANPWVWVFEFRRLP